MAQIIEILDEAGEVPSEVYKWLEEGFNKPIERPKTIIIRDEREIERQDKKKNPSP
jgi:hypothetical protein